MYLHHDANGSIDSVGGIVSEMIIWMSEKYNFT